jgi:CheY-like chemotaxis protein
MVVTSIGRRAAFSQAGSVIERRAIMLHANPDFQTLSRRLSAPAILVVDNEDGIRELAETVLSEAGYPVLTAKDGATGFRLLERHPHIALLFTDIVMPKIDGLMLADMAKLRRPGIKVLYATAYHDEMNRQPGYRYGEILAKPYRPTELETAVRHALAAPSLRVHPAA